MVELQPSKLDAWVRFPSPAPYSSIHELSAAATALIEDKAHVAQSAEHVLGKDEVSGSIPLMGSI